MPFFIREILGQDDEAGEDGEMEKEEEEEDQRRGKAGAERASGSVIAI